MKPLVDEYFTWLKSLQDSPEMDQSSKTAKAINYSINQEAYLRLFLTDAMIPLDNNDAERSIRAFCIGKKNWQIIESKQGAEASPMFYSIENRCGCIWMINRKNTLVTWFRGQISYQKAAKSKTGDLAAARRSGNF